MVADMRDLPFADGPFASVLRSSRSSTCRIPSGSSPRSRGCSGRTASRCSSPRTG